ncbi:hypothetical protein [Neptuniibacter caesariensis]|uniref:4-oxalocrotonate tautomerase domain-containing protein n=1 Tax=Neptuniibacter caesariensis TaxID=207954 RepID=A0A7U8C550_NEPCE|nr:hypothetical protein [Neptuniibacter caesariensis]EAR60489.1 hypothetical protein MED92_09171 [Oceanospirillum sp. MED92] [Neptuniibacter caesariensis]
MPLICIKSLPFDSEIDVPAMIKSITEDFARGTDVSVEHITVTWEFIPERQYAVAGLMPSTQPQSGSHPVLVELHAPSFHASGSVEAMLECIAFSVSKRSGVAYSNIFIRYCKVQSGTIFDQGKLVRWK